MLPKGTRRREIGKEMLVCIIWKTVLPDFRVAGEGVEKVASSSYFVPRTWIPRMFHPFRVVLLSGENTLPRIEATAEASKRKARLISEWVWNAPLLQTDFLYGVEIPCVAVMAKHRFYISWSKRDSSLTHNSDSRTLLTKTKREKLTLKPVISLCLSH